MGERSPLRYSDLIIIKDRISRISSRYPVFLFLHIKFCDITRSEVDRGESDAVIVVGFVR